MLKRFFFQLFSFPAAVLSLAIISVDVHAVETSAASPGIPAAYFPYSITSYNVNLSADEKRRFHVTERITAQFNEKRHGLYRTIPEVGTIDTGKNSPPRKIRYRARVSDVKVRDSVTGKDIQFDLEAGRTDRLIKIGDPDKTVTGDVAYDISYDYEILPDGDVPRDALYFSIIGGGWDAPVTNVSFSVAMPKPFEPGGIGIIAGSSGSERGIPFLVRGSVISGSYQGPLRPGEGITLRASLTDGYFSAGSGVRENVWMIIFAATGLLCVVIMLRARRRRNTPAEAVSERNPAEFAMMLGGLFKNRALPSLIPYWAEKGLLRINGADAKNPVIEKVRGLEKNAEMYEKLFFGALFCESDRVTPSSLSGSEKYRLQAVSAQDKLVRFLTEKGSLYESDGKKGRIICYSLSFLCMVLTLGTGLSWNASEFYQYAGAFFIGLCMSIWYGPNIAGIEICAKRLRFGRYFGFLSGVFFYACMLASVAGLVLYSYGFDRVTVAGCAASFVCMIAGAFSRKLSSRGENAAAGFDVVRRRMAAHMKRLSGGNSTDTSALYSEILPYAFVLNLAGKWGGSFEGLSVQPPSWYNGAGGGFDRLDFISNMNSFLENSRSAMSSSSSDSGGGGSSGGVGGGGGGSW
jgi:hypothetical protein